MESNAELVGSCVLPLVDPHVESGSAQTKAAECNKTSRQTKEASASRAVKINRLLLVSIRRPCGSYRPGRRLADAPLQPSASSIYCVAANWLRAQHHSASVCRALTLHLFFFLEGTRPVRRIKSPLNRMAVAVPRCQCFQLAGHAGRAP